MTAALSVAGPTTATAPPFLVRQATGDDNAALVGLSDLCPMEGDIGLCVSRAPDFFALNRLEGDDWIVGVAEQDGRLLGCAAVARRRVYLDGRPQTVAYFGDLKVDPGARRRGVARALLQWAARRCDDMVGSAAPVLATVLAGNTAAEKVLLARDAAIPFRPLATVRAFSIPLFSRRRHEDLLRVEIARPEHLDEMAELWPTVAARRPFAHAFEAASLRAWIQGAPGLGVESYRVCRAADGRLVGFAGLWDQRPFKRLRVTRYSWTLRAVALGLNAAATLLRRPRLPPVGEFLDYVSLVNVCVADGVALRSLLAAAYDELQARGYFLMSLGLDRTDPLTAALSGFGAQPTDVNVLAAAPGAPFTTLGTPVHHEIALV